MAKVAAVLGLLVLVVFLYASTFETPWVYDDIDGIRHNPALREGGALAEIVTASPPDSTPYGRPLLALSVALNRAVSGFDPWSYRALNLALHLGSALLLFDLLQQSLSARVGASAEKASRIACWTALLFAVHPLATTVVTYTVQRAEGLMAFFYLATLAASARGLADERRWWWRFCAVICCALGMFAKETMATAPLAVLVLHRAGFATSWRMVARRWRWHLALASTWTLLAACMWAWPRHQSVGFGYEGMGGFDYLNLQTGAWWHYLGLLFAPWRIAIDHWPQPGGTREAFTAGLSFATLYVVAVVVAWRRSPLVGVGLLLPGLILLPTSTVIPIFTSPVADHRMYLPGGFAAALAAGGLSALDGRRPWIPRIVLALALLALAVGTVQRNQVFCTERMVWADAVAQEPGNARALNNLGMALANEGHVDDGEARIHQALRLNARYADAWYNLGTLQGRDGRLASAEESFGRSLVIRPASASAHCNLALVLYRRGKKAEAIRHYEEAIRLRSEYPAANFNLAVVYLEAGDYARALSHAQNCLRGDPGYPKVKELVQDLHRALQGPQASTSS
jgi:Tfp pilus assembly protein PilF